MKYLIISIILLILPFLLIVIVNENSNSIAPKVCTWNCHNNTSICKEKHTKLLINHIDKIDIGYNFIIQSLTQTGNYKRANIIFLVVIWPLLMLFLIIANIYLFQKLNNGKAH